VLCLPLKFFKNPVGNPLSLTHYRSAESPGGDTTSMPDSARVALAAIAFALTAAPALAQDSYSDPAGSGVLVSAVNWLQGTLLGTIATVVAVIAVAAVGFMMLTGRINWRYGVTVILGCFILFGASSIVAGIHSAATLGQ
jgi:type IV secretion system protein VirB2